MKLLRDPIIEQSNPRQELLKKVCPALDFRPTAFAHACAIDRWQLWHVRLGFGVPDGCSPFIHFHSTVGAVSDVTQLTDSFALLCSRGRLSAHKRLHQRGQLSNLVLLLLNCVQQNRLNRRLWRDLHRRSLNETWQTGWWGHHTSKRVRCSHRTPHDGTSGGMHTPFQRRQVRHQTQGSNTRHAACSWPLVGWRNVRPAIPSDHPRLSWLISDVVIAWPATAFHLSKQTTRPATAYWALLLSFERSPRSATTLKT